MAGSEQDVSSERDPVAICPNCGHENETEIRYCDQCGVQMGAITTPDAHPDEVVDDEITAGGSSYTEREQQI